MTAEKIEKKTLITLRQCHDNSMINTVPGIISVITNIINIIIRVYTPERQCHHWSQCCWSYQAAVQVSEALMPRKTCSLYIVLSTIHPPPTSHTHCVRYFNTSDYYYYYYWNGVVYSVGRVCLSDDNFQSLDIASSYLHSQYISEEYRSKLYIKAWGQGHRSNKGPK